jgi:hypothetical protein
VVLGTGLESERDDDEQPDESPNLPRNPQPTSEGAALVKEMTMTPSQGGPHVQVALLCETIIRGAETGRLSVINIIDGATFAGEDPDDMPPFTIGPPLKLVINLWAGQTKGRYSLKLRPEAPSGIQGDAINLGALQFADTGARGVDTILAMPEYEITEEGTYWFDVLFANKEQEDRLLTRIPLTVAYQPQRV